MIKAAVAPKIPFVRIVLPSKPLLPWRTEVVKGHYLNRMVKDDQLPMELAEGEETTHNFWLCFTTHQQQLRVVGTPHSRGKSKSRCILYC